MQQERLQGTACITYPVPQSFEVFVSMGNKLTHHCYLTRTDVQFEAESVVSGSTVFLPTTYRRPPPLPLDMRFLLSVSASLKQARVELLVAGMGTDKLISRYILSIA